MGRLTTTFMGSAAAGLTALAVNVAAPAIGAGANDAGAKDDGAKVEHRNGPTPEALTQCLSDHGATGLPDPNDGEGRALKQWIVAHQSDQAARAALQACDVYFDEGKPQGGTPDEKKTFDCGPKDGAKARVARSRAVRS